MWRFRGSGRRDDEIKLITFTTEQPAEKTKRYIFPPFFTFAVCCCCVLNVKKLVFTFSKYFSEN